MRFRNLMGLHCRIDRRVVLGRRGLGSGPGETRFGVWDNSTNPNNVMTYEPFEKGGMKITVSNPSKPGADWSYVTMFDGKFRARHGPELGDGG